MKHFTSCEMKKLRAAYCCDTAEKNQDLLVVIAGGSMAIWALMIGRGKFRE